VIAVDEAPRAIPGTETGMQPLYLARIEDLGRGDLVQVDCAAGVSAAARAQPQRQGSRSQRARSVLRVRSEGTRCRVGEVGAPERIRH
jgi:hypothetical protein